MSKQNLLSWLLMIEPTTSLQDNYIRVKDLLIHYVDLLDMAQLGTLTKQAAWPTNYVRIYSDEWEDRTVACKSVLSAKLGLSDTKIGARKCEIKTISKTDGLDFLETYHLQGANAKSLVFFGLYYNSLLIAVASLGPHTRYSATNLIVMDRLCFKPRFRVVGGSGKLLKTCLVWAKDRKYDEIITYSDSRITEGKVYDSLGFIAEQDRKPDHLYVLNGKRLSKQSQKKDKTKCPETFTEFEWATHRGLTRIYDLGKKRWVININPDSHKTWLDKNSENTARMHEKGVFKHSHIRGYFSSNKNNIGVYFGSSYELRCLYTLETNTNVVSFKRADAFKAAIGWRNPDVFAVYCDGSKEVIEVKPKELLTNEAVVSQLKDSYEYCKLNNIRFKVWTEDDSGLNNAAAIVKWATEYLKLAQNDTVWADRHRQQRQAIRERYEASHPDELLQIECGWCKETHTVREKSYTPNIARNGRYICEREGGHIAGSRPKDHLKKTNPYAGEGKKECTKCKGIKPIADFHERKASWDKLSSDCKVCSAETAKARRAKPDFVRKSSGTCSCGELAYTKGMCDKCYLRVRRAARKSAVSAPIV